MVRFSFNSSSTEDLLAFRAVDTDDILSRIEAMRIQEESVYHCGDYLHQQLELSKCVWAQPLQENWSMPPPCDDLVDEECRAIMSEWCYQVVDFCKLNRETVWIAMSYLDRYLSTQIGARALVDRDMFQLVGATSLYIATKLFDREALSLEVVEALCNGKFTEQDIINAELSILAALQWHVNPPTAVSFVQHFLALLPSEVGTSTRQAIINYSRFQTELAVSEYSFVTVNASTIALVSILNTMNTMDFSIPPSTRWSFFQTITSTGIDPYSPDLKQVQRMLMEKCQDMEGSSGMHDTVYAVPFTILLRTLRRKRKTNWERSPTCASREPAPFVA